MVTKEMTTQAKPLSAEILESIKRQAAAGTQMWSLTEVLGLLATIEALTAKQDAPMTNPTDTAEEAAREWLSTMADDPKSCVIEEDDYDIKSLAALLRERERAGIEAAAKVCETGADNFRKANSFEWSAAMRAAADLVRALLPKEGT